MEKEMKSIFDLYQKLYDESVALRKKQREDIVANTKRHLADLDKGENPSLVIKEMKEEEALLKKDLKVCEYHSQKIYEEVEKLKKKLNEKELLEVEEYENQLIEKMNSQMGKKIPELQLLEDRMASVLSGDINFLKSANTMTKVIVIGKIIVSIFLLITAFGFDDYGVYQGMRIIISVLGLGLAICLIGSTFSEQYKIKNNFNTFISLDIMYNILVFFMFAFSSMTRAGWIIIDIFFIIIYLVFAICIDKYRPILKCK